MNLIYLAEPTYGGWVSFTAHLALKHDLPIFKLAKRTEKTLRPFGYGTKYRNIKVSDLSGTNLIVCVDRKHLNRLYDFADGTFLVIHDPAEVSARTIPLFRRFQLITIRKSVQDYLVRTYHQQSRLILHPFFPYRISSVPKLTAVSVSRIDFDKHTELILEANKKGGNIDLYGSSNRLYVFQKLKDLPFQESWKGSFPKSFEALDGILSPAKYCVDMSLIKHDGGGTQYTFLEAIHQGCLLVLHRKWVEGFESVFQDKKNCVLISNASDLVEVVSGDYPGIAEEARQLLQPHIDVDWLTSLSTC